MAPKKIAVAAVNAALSKAKAATPVTIGSGGNKVGGAADAKAPPPAFTLPQSIVLNKQHFFDTVFGWYVAKNGGAPTTTADASMNASSLGGSTTCNNSSANTSSPLVSSIPWRVPPFNKDPYAIWVSEVMSQQTQLATVVRYWTAWMKVFPTVEALAAADGEAVRAVWAGMGYYRRADLLHKGAQYIVNEYRGAAAAQQGEQHKQSGGQSLLFPTTYEEWVKLVPGVGPYTAAAITSLCFDVPATAVDGNVMRVMSRLCGARGVDPKDPKHLALLQGVLNEGLLAPKKRRQQQQLTANKNKTNAKGVITDVDADDEGVVVDVDAFDGDDGVEATIATSAPFLADCPPDRRGRVNEGLMEIGASICRPNATPLCGECPFSVPLPTSSFASASSNPNPNPQPQQRFCTAYSMLLNSDIEAIDGIIPMRGSATAVKAMAVNSYVVFIAGGDTKRGATITRKAVDAGADADAGDGASSKIALLRSLVAGYSVLCVTRPQGGLLSQMTDFPSVELNEKEAAKQALQAEKGVLPSNTKKRAHATAASKKKASAAHGGSSFSPQGSFVHVFSHIRMTVNVFAAVVESEAEGRALLSSSALLSSFADEGRCRDQAVFTVPLDTLSSFPVSQLALKSLQNALPAVMTAAGDGEDGPAASVGDAKLLAHELCNRRIAGQKAPRE